MAEKTINHQLSAIPCPESLADVDLFSPGAQEHWYEAYEILHRESPVHPIPGEGLQPGGDAFILTRYEDIDLVVKDPVRFPPLISMRVQHLLEEDAADERALANAMELSMATLRPTDELYRAHRQELTDPWVGLGATRHTEQISEITRQLVSQWIDEGEVEFISGFARPLPQYVMAHVLGFPEEDIPRLEAWGVAQVMPFVHGCGHRNVLSRAQAAEQREQLRGFSDYVQQQVEAKRRKPADDMISFLTGVEYQALGRRLTDLEICGIVYAMVLGGLETTQYALEEQAQLLCDDPALYARLRADRGKLRPFLEEAMRVRAPTQGLSTRVTARDEVFQGVTVPAGSLLHLRFGAANVDGEAFACPHAIDLERKAVSRHLTFSAGPRVCPGAHISRLEQQIAWNCLLDNIETMEYAPGNNFLHQPGIMLGTLELKLRFRRAAGGLVQPLHDNQ
jgi:cytochrome P450